MLLATASPGALASPLHTLYSNLPSDLHLHLSQGTSEWSAHDIEKAIGVADRLGLVRPIVEQPEYNLVARQRVEHEYASLYRDYGMGLTTWSPLASGILTGKYSGKATPEGSRLTLPAYKFLTVRAYR